MLAQGTPLHVVSEVLEHAGIAIAKDTYGHLMEGEIRDVDDQISTVKREMEAAIDATSATCR
ncbi:hypothetical protein [Planotetraspora kaengkrachanensis]|uniref:Integrase n=1 Tax=Planotetraspora kaengkrachanensis TaxID=575193 RepID=A0A8J3PZA8_9ACTN|nr:hypothetical protein [Planotetraspora kaengkrachanensis]GIG83782.1 hypothetical protein Pka01_69090 [Planotetraspora kaengkrachanensis]